MRRMKAKQVHPTIASALLVDAAAERADSRRSSASCGVARPSISQYENGKKDPSVMNLNRLIQACGMELHLRADHLSEADRAQAFRDAAVGTAEALQMHSERGWLGADASADAGRESWIERLSPRCLGVRRQSSRCTDSLRAWSSWGRLCHYRKLWSHPSER